MTFGTFELPPDFVNILGVFEVQSGKIALEIADCLGRSLQNNQMTSGAVVGESLTLFVFHNAVMTPETAVVYKVTEIVFPDAIIGLHLGEKVLVIYLEQNIDSPLDVFTVACGQIRVIFPLVCRELGSDRLVGFFPV